MSQTLAKLFVQYAMPTAPARPASELLSLIGGVGADSIAAGPGGCIPQRDDGRMHTLAMGEGGDRFPPGRGGGCFPPPDRTPPGGGGRGANLEELMRQQEALHNRIQAAALRSAMEKALHDAAMQLIGNI